MCSALMGRDVTLLAITTRGRPNSATCAIVGIVRNKSAVIAEVAQETYDADPRILFLTVSSAS
jgi:hypothetical protein